MATAQDLLDLARVPLNDAAKVRLSDAQGLNYLNYGLKLLRRKRADLFIGTLNGDFTALEVGDIVTAPEHTHQALADYVTARAETHDDEAAMNERAKDFFAMARGAL